MQYVYVWLSCICKLHLVRLCLVACIVHLHVKVEAGKVRRSHFYERYWLVQAYIF